MKRGREIERVKFALEARVMHALVVEPSLLLCRARRGALESFCPPVRLILLLPEAHKAHGVTLIIECRRVQFFPSSRRTCARAKIEERFIIFVIEHFASYQNYHELDYRDTKSSDYDELNENSKGNLIKSNAKELEMRRAFFSLFTHFKSVFFLLLRCFFLSILPDSFSFHLYYDSDGFYDVCGWSLLCRRAITQNAFIYIYIYINIHTPHVIKLRIVIQNADDVCEQCNFASAVACDTKFTSPCICIYVFLYMSNKYDAAA